MCNDNTLNVCGFQVSDDWDGLTEHLEAVVGQVNIVEVIEVSASFIDGTPTMSADPVFLCGARRITENCVGWDRPSKEDFESAAIIDKQVFKNRRAAMTWAGIQTASLGYLD